MPTKESLEKLLISIKKCEPYQSNFDKVMELIDNEIAEADQDNLTDNISYDYAESLKTTRRKEGKMYEKMREKYTLKKKTLSYYQDFISMFKMNVNRAIGFLDRIEKQRAIDEQKS